MQEDRPKLPVPEPVAVMATKTALLVLDLSEVCDEPGTPFNRLVPGMTAFLGRARAAGLPIVFTVPAALKGTPAGQVYSGFQRRPSEPVIFPDGFDKFAGGDLASFLALFHVDTLIITGSRSNICVLYTATKAARELGYRVVIPIDGIAANTDYEQEYTLYQFTTLPGGAARRISFTRLEMISFD